LTCLNISLEKIQNTKHITLVYAERTRHNMANLLYVMIFLYGIIFGSFLNVCIYRIPNKGSLMEHSHCMKCGYHLAWYDLLPVFSYICLRGKCRKCGEKISIQYPLVELLNGVLWVIVFTFRGFTVDSVIYCVFVSALLVLSVIDLRTYEIPDGINLFIAIVGGIHLVLHIDEWPLYVIGFFSVSLVLWIINRVTAGRAMGGGDVKLMAAAGLLVGWKLALVGFLEGCILGSVIHLIRMKISEQGNVLAMGPYLAGGLFIALLVGDHMITWYLGICGL